MSLYTEDEERKIVQYIVSTKSINLIKGDKLWKDMEKAGIVDRTWQSLKQHFRKRIIYDLNTIKHGIDQQTIEQFRRSFNKITYRNNTSRKKVAELEKRRVTPKNTTREESPHFEFNPSEANNPTREENSSDSDIIDLGHESDSN